MILYLLVLLAVWNLIVLLAQALLGGGTGAILAGHLCHHKTRKWYFNFSWYVGLLVDAGLIFLIIKFFAK